jgi:hypothetical protein
MVEEGTHDELWRRRGQYHRLFRSYRAEDDARTAAASGH